MYLRFNSLLSAFIVALALFLPSGSVAQTPASKDVLLVLPFENTSNQPEYHWVGETFPDALADLLTLPGLVVIPNDERELIYQRLQIPLTILPSRATAIKLAREAKATLVLVGTYTVTPVKDSMAVALQVNARLIKVSEGRYEGSSLDLGGALTALQEMHGRLAYEILYQRDRALAFSRNHFIERATKVPQRAFESYVKGVMTDDLEKRTAYLTNAQLEYARVKPNQTYSQAAFELGHIFLNQQDWKKAVEHFSKVDKSDRYHAEAAFYTGFALWRMNENEQALQTLVPLAAEVPLTRIYNNAGALSLLSAGKAQQAEDRTRLLTQGLDLLQRAAESAPDDLTVRFNYAHALFANGKYAEAAEQLQNLVQLSKGDGQAFFLYAKSLERVGRAQEATTADNEARRYFQSYAKWQTGWEKGQTLFDVQPRLYSVFNRRPFYDKLRREQLDAGQTTESTSQVSEDLLAKARDLYRQGRDEEALPELRRVLTIEPMSAEAYLLIGRIHQRRGDLDEAISTLKTSVFWDAKQIEAHILLGRIFLERGDRAMASTYANNALQIDPNNQEAIALQRQVTMGGR